MTNSMESWFNFVQSKYVGKVQLLSAIETRHYMATCKLPCDLWTSIAQASQQLFYNGPGSLGKSHPHKQSFQLC